MDYVERAIEAFKAQATAPARTRLRALLEVERLADPRAMWLLVDVLADAHESAEVRLRALKRLTGGVASPSLRTATADAIIELLAPETSLALRQRAASALAHFTDVQGVVGALGRLALDSEEPIDLRYSAFVSLQSAGPTPECIALVWRLSADETLGPSARSLIAACPRERGRQ